MNDTNRERRGLGPVSAAWKVTAIGAVIGLAVFAAPDDRTLDELVRQDGVYVDPQTGEPFSGVAFATFSAHGGGVAQKLNLWAGAYHGPFESYFRDQSVSAKETFLRGVRHGPFESYFEDGKLFEEGSYVEGRREGTYRAYWETGQLYEEGTYLDGDFDGPRRWYVDGRLVEMVTYRSGVIDGLYERYREDGSLDLKGMLQNGSPCGVWFEDERSIAYAPCGIAVTE